MVFEVKLNIQHRLMSQLLQYSSSPTVAKLMNFLVQAFMSSSFSLRIIKEEIYKGIIYA